jgi:hypothetical protein
MAAAAPPAMLGRIMAGLGVAAGAEAARAVIRGHEFLKAARKPTEAFGAAMVGPAMHDAFDSIATFDDGEDTDAALVTEFLIAGQTERVELARVFNPRDAVMRPVLVRLCPPHAEVDLTGEPAVGVGELGIEVFD